MSFVNSNISFYVFGSIQALSTKITEISLSRLLNCFSILEIQKRLDIFI